MTGEQDVDRVADLDLYNQAKFAAPNGDLPLDQQLTAKADRARVVSEVALGDFGRPKGPYGWLVD